MTAAPLLPATAAELAALACVPLARPLAGHERDRLLTLVAQWSVEAGALSREFAFAGYLPTIAFVNALAWMAERQDHHPDLLVRHGRCRVTWSTHSAGGLTLNDFICAALTDQLNR